MAPYMSLYCNCFIIMNVNHNYMFALSFSPIPNTIPQQETLSPGITSYKNISPRVQGQVTYPNPSLGGYSEVLPWTDQKMYEKWNSDRVSRIISSKIISFILP